MPRRTLLSAGLGIATVLVLAGAALAAAQLPTEVDDGGSAAIVVDREARETSPVIEETPVVDESVRTPTSTSAATPPAPAPTPPAPAPTPPAPGEPVYDCRELEGREVCDTFGESDEGPGTYDDGDEGPGTR